MLVSVITMYHDSLLALGLPVENYWQTTGLASLNTGQETILHRLGLPCSGCGDLLMEQLKIALMYSYPLLSVFEWPTQTTIGVLCYLSVSRRHQADSPDKWSSEMFPQRRSAANSRWDFKSTVTLQYKGLLYSPVIPLPLTLLTCAPKYPRLPLADGLKRKVQKIKEETGRSKWHDISSIAQCSQDRSRLRGAQCYPKSKRWTGNKGNLN